MTSLRLVSIILFFFHLTLNAQNLEVRKEFSVQDLQPKKVAGRKYVDVALFNYRNSGMKWKDFKKKVIKLQEHYRAAGVHINIVKSFELKLKTKTIRANTITGIDPDLSVAPYEAVRLRANRLGERAEKVFNEMSKLVDNSENTLLVSVFKNISYQSYYTREGERIRLNKGIQGFSFPPYSFGDNIPRHLRGVIAIVPSVSAKTISHELGHKLINVSHEGKGVCPRFEGGGVPGLMGYSRNTTIHSGREGRFHLERLAQSPFIYQYTEGAQKAQNPDYVEGGHYRDPIYEGLFFESECPLSLGPTRKLIPIILIQYFHEMICLRKRMSQTLHCKPNLSIIEGSIVRSRRTYAFIKIIKNYSVLSLFAISSISNAGFLVEPYLGYQLGSGDRGNLEYDYNSPTMGARLGYTFLGFMGGVDYSLSSFDLETTNTVTNASAESEYKKNQLGLFVGYELPILLRAWATYYVSAKLEDKISPITETSGGGYALGVGSRACLLSL